jgi:DNA primase catalytic core
LWWRIAHQLPAAPDPDLDRSATGPLFEPPEPDEPEPPDGDIPPPPDQAAPNTDPDPWDDWTQAEVEAIARVAMAPAEPAPARTLARHQDSGVPAERILELNQLAQDFFTHCYPTSWAPKYLRARLGDDLAADPRVTPGYAPAGWRSLTEHLHRLGASDTEILAAGLGIRASTGRIIDRFRDRLVLPIRSPDGIAGFIARRNPRHDSDTGGERHGPKYLNTADTPAYTKGAHLYGLHQVADALDAGAVPVLVEGPIDAIAVTRAGDGRYVGVAPLGTALTDTQADQLRPHLRPGGSGVIVGTDPDLAGRQAAARAFWQFAVRGGDPRQLVLPEGTDPADLYTRSPHALLAALDAPTSLAEQLISDRIEGWADILDTAEGRVGAARAAAAVIVALPPRTWPEHLDRLTATTGLHPRLLHTEVLHAMHPWTLDPAGQAQQQTRHDLDLLRPNRQDEPPSAPVTPIDPPTRWKPLADSLDPRLTQGPDWPPLAAAIDRAHRASADLDRLLPSLFVDQPLPTERPAQALRYRLIAACPSAATPGPANPIPATAPGPAATPAPNEPPAAPPPLPGRAPMPPAAPRR